MNADQPWLGFAVSYELDPNLSDAEHQDFTGSFLRQAIEPNGLSLHGGGKSSFIGFVNAVYPNSTSEEQRRAVVTWLASVPSVLTFQVGPVEAESTD